MTDEVKNYPYDDEYMIFDKELNQYILTEKAAQELGINLTARFRQKGAVNAEILVRNTMRQISTMIYQYLHAHVFDTCLQDYYISILPSARLIMRRALEQQLLYYMQVGNLSRSTDKNKRSLAIDDIAREILNTIIPELGHSLTYAGGWRKCLTF